MSGGSFNYLCLQRDSRGHIDLADLESMRDRLRELAPGHPATKATERLYESLTADLDGGLAEVWHDVEWFDSGDYGWDQVEAELRRYEESDVSRSGRTSREVLG